MIVGIDLGTTNSLVSVWKDGRAQRGMAPDDEQVTALPDMPVATSIQPPVDDR